MDRRNDLLLGEWEISCFGDYETINGLESILKIKVNQELS